MSQWNADRVEIVTDDAGPLTFDVWSTPHTDATTATVLALHGFPQGARSYETVAGLLAARGIRVIAPDQRGYSPDARPVGVEHYRDNVLAADAVAIAAALGAERFHLVGHDWGAHIAWVTAATYPDRVLSLTAVSVPHPTAFSAAIKSDPDQARKSEYIKLFWQEGKAEAVLLKDDGAYLRQALEDVEPAMIGYYVERLQQPGALTAALSYYRGMHGGTTPSVTVPTTYVWSDGDHALGRTGAEACGQYVDADYRFVPLSGITHWIPEKAPEALADAITHRVTSA